jgi:hypothetical protein
MLMRAKGGVGGTPELLRAKNDCAFLVLLWPIFTPEFCVAQF